MGQAALAFAALIALWGVALALVRRSPGALYAGGAVWAVLLVGAAGVVGIAVALFEHPPRDPLHILYGLLAAATLPAALLVANDRPPEKRPVVWAAAGIVLVLLVVRLFQTGG